MLSADYIVGLTDGEGSFTVFIHPFRKGLSKYPRIECRYYIKLREDELSLLEEVKNFFGCGSIYLQKEKRLNHRNCYRFEISSYQKISEVVIPFFQKHHPRSIGRKNDFDLFCKIFEIVSDKKGRHITEKELKQIKELKLQMHKYRAPLRAGNPLA